MKRSRLWKFVGLLAMCSGGLFAASVRGQETVEVLESRPEPGWDQKFQRTSGWLGADGNYAIRVAPDRVLWFFSDTLIGRIADGKRIDSRMVNNSVGVQSGPSGQETVEFFYRNSPQAEPQSMFRPDNPSHWEWLVGGTVIQERVHLLTWELQRSSDPGVFGFAMTGVNHIEIENPLDRPTDWKFTRRSLPCTEISPQRRFVLGAAVMQDEEYTYVYGTLETPEKRLAPRQMVVARVPSASFSDYTTWKFQTATGWSSDFQDSAALASGIASEYSVSRVPETKHYLCVSHADLLSPKIQARTASAPEGPWTDPIDLWTCPEPAAHKGYFAYSGKAHPEISTGEDLLITYAVNSFQFGDLFSDPTLYWPRFVRVKLKMR